MTILEYSLRAVIRRKRKNIFMFIIIFLLSFAAFSVLFTASSLKQEMIKTVSELPELVVQKQVGGRHQLIEESRIPEILSIRGVENVLPRVWGYHYFAYLNSSFSITGVDFFEEKYREDLESAAELLGIDQEVPHMLVSKKIFDTVNGMYQKDSYDFPLPNGDYLKVKIKGVFKQSTEMLSADTIIMDVLSARKVLGVPSGYATDFVISVPNADEMQQVMIKILNRFPDLKLVSKEDVRSAYVNVFDYKSGIFLALLLTALVTMFVVVFDKAGGLESDERREVGVLKAVGWKIDDVIKMKLFEASAVSFTAFLSALLFSIIFIYFTDAPLVRELFTGFSYLRPDFRPAFTLDLISIAVVFFITVPVYVAASVIPAWKVASMDVKEALK